jgi:GDPmannose 4,6-dehydratase
VETLLGDSSYAHKRLGWRPTVSFEDLVKEMVEADLVAAERDQLVKKHGYNTYEYHE